MFRKHRWWEARPGVGGEPRNARRWLDVRVPRAFRGERVGWARRAQFLTALAAAMVLAVSGCSAVRQQSASPGAAPAIAQNGGESKAPAPDREAARPKPVNPQPAASSKADPDTPVSNTPEPPPTGAGDTQPGEAAQETSPEGALPVTTLDRGTQSRVTEPGAVLIRAQEQWEQHWRQHTVRFPAPAVPEVDFTRHSVLAVYLGQKPTGGYSVTVREVRLSGSTLIVTAVERRPPPGSIVTQALTHPYHIVQIPAVPEGTIVEVRWQ